MLGLLAAGFVTSDLTPGQPWTQQLLTKPGLKRVVAVVVLLVLLMLMADVGFGGPAAVFGGVILLSYLGTHAAGFGPAILALERRAFA